MSTENKTVARRWFDEVINGRRPAAVEEIFAPEYVHHGNLGDGMGRDELKQFAAAILAAYPDRKATVEDVLAEGDKVVVRWTSTGTRQAAFLGREPTTKRETAKGIWIARVRDGKAVEGWEIVDLGEPAQ
jgi:predicted SnoaL-like aldol condensation-catalyzing enzyme